MKRFLPPYLFFICIGLMLVLHYLLPGPTIIPAVLQYAGVGFLLLGVALAIKGSRHFARVETNINTFDKPDLLVTDGLFRYSRNPMYLGFALALFGVFVFLGSTSPALVCIVFVLITHYWYIRFEEKVMYEMFGDEYTQYKRQTRRWI